VNNCATPEVIKNYIENQGNQDEKEAYEQVKIFEFE
jgi:putative transposase